MNIYRIFFKRIVDIIVSFSAILVLFIPGVLLAIIIGVMSKSPPLFFQKRPGLNGRIFQMIKFKSMNNAKDENGNLLPDIDRVTSIGKFIRKTSLDELPELLNILKGDMSLVGPRPLLVKYLPYYTEREHRRHLVRPGITGLSQINGRHNLNWDDRLEMDVQYVENVSFYLDIKIMFQTLIQVVRQKDVNVVSSVTMPDFDDYRMRDKE